MLKKYILFICLIFVFVNCGPKLVKKDEISKINKLGILSVVIDKARNENPGNNRVVQNAVNYALSVYKQKLNKLNFTKVVSLNSYKNNDIYLNLINNFLKNNKRNSNKLNTSLYSAFGINESEYSVNGKLKKSISKILSAENLPLISYDLLSNASDDNSSKITPEKKMVKTIGNVCKKLGLDAFLLIHLKTRLGYLGKTRLISGKRISSNTSDIKMRATAMIISKNGEILLDLGMPTLDDLAPSEHSPLYKNENGRVILDLEDSRGEILRDYKKLVDRTSKKLIKKLNKIVK